MHNPEKNKIVCTIAKVTKYGLWCLGGLLALVWIVTLIVLITAPQSLLQVITVAAIFLGILGIIVGVVCAYIWAEGYLESC